MGRLSGGGLRDRPPLGHREPFGTSENTGGMIPALAGLYRQGLVSEGGGLWWSRPPHDSFQLTKETSASVSYLLACLLIERDHKFDEFKCSEQAIVVLPVNDYVIV